MDPADKELLIVRRPQLVENIDLNGGLFTQLLSRKVISSRSVQTITYNKPPDRQVEELLDLLPKRGPTAFALFCEALIADDQEDVVKYILQKRENAASSNVTPSTSSTSLTESTPSTSATPVVPPVNPIAQAATGTVISTNGCMHNGAKMTVESESATPIDAESLPTTSQKRKPEQSENREPEENDDTSGTSETDSCPTTKRIRHSSPSVIRIKGDDDKNVFKIYQPQAEVKPLQLVEQMEENVTQTEGKGLRIEGATRQTEGKQTKSPDVNLMQFADGKFTHPAEQSDLDNKPFQPGECRYILKHFIDKNTGQDGSADANRRLAASLLSDLPEQCLKMLSSSPKPYKERESNNYAVTSLRDRLLRCDSTDTMEHPHTNICLEGPQQADSAHALPSTVMLSQSTGMSAAQRRPVDLPDGPVSVRVEHSSRQFYQSMQHKAYRMVGMPRGQALIINVNEVHDKPPRRGTDIDRDNLHNLLKQLYFEVTVYNDQDDLTALGIVNKLKAFAAKREHIIGDASILCLLSHGEEGYIFGTDGKRIPLDEIFLLFDNHRCPALLNKPKVFFIQACRGGALDRGVKMPLDETDGGPGPQSATSLVQHPSMSDMLICYPTMEGYFAWRNRERGSWYIEAVVQVFMHYAKSEDICAMLNRVNELVSRKVSRCMQAEMDRMSQMSEYKSSLRRPYLFFFPGIGCPSID